MQIEGGKKYSIYRVKWVQLCEAKENGGIGFKEIEKFNDALLGKQVWHMA